MELQEAEETEALIAAPAHAGAAAQAGGLNRSVISGIVVGFLLRCAGGASGALLGFYLNRVVNKASGVVDPGIIAALTLTFFAVELLLAPAFGSWSDRLGRKPFLLAGPIIACLAVQIHPLTTLIAVITLGRLLEGLATSISTPATLGFLSDVTSGNAGLRGRVMGLYELGSLGGIVLGPALGGGLWDWFERNGFRLVSILDIAAALLVIFYIRESRPVAAEGPAPAAAGSPGAPSRSWRARFAAYAEILRLPRLWRFAPAWIAVNGVVGLWFSHIPPLVSRAHPEPGQLLSGGWTGLQFAWAEVGFGVAFAVGIYFWGARYARLRKTNIMLLALAGAVGVCVVLFAINVQVLPGPWGQWPLVPVLLVGLFLMSAFTPVALAYLADVTEGSVANRGTVMGLYSVFLALGQVIGTALGAPFIRAFAFNGLVICTLLLVAVATGAVVNLRHSTGD